VKRAENRRLHGHTPGHLTSGSVLTSDCTAIQAAIWAREDMASLSKICWTWLSTVRGAITSRSAIWRLACELARSTNFLPTLTSASIDLLLNLARRGEVGRALALERDVATMAEKGRSWHGWLWSLRLAQARAEIALARGSAHDTLQFADSAVQQARGRRPKYEVLGLVTRASALSSLDRTREAIVDLQTAMRVARRMEDPALVLRSAAALLALDGSDSLAKEASASAQRIFERLPDDTMRGRFRGEMSKSLHVRSGISL
jgi:hypothetical protein